MEPHLSTTPFGRRSLTLAHVAAQQVAKSRPPEKAVHKWNVFRAICTAKPRIGVSERALSVLNALLTFYPETVLTGQDLIVFPSNRQLALRAHGMAPATLRRHLAALVDVGLIVRRDSPNGKRYARKDREGEIELAFGFDLSPLVVRGRGIRGLGRRDPPRAAGARLRQRADHHLSPGHRQDDHDGHGGGGSQPGVEGGGHQTGWSCMGCFARSWSGFRAQAARATLEPIAEELSLLADEILKPLGRSRKTIESKRQ